MPEPTPIRPADSRPEAWTTVEELPPDLRRLTEVCIRIWRRHLREMASIEEEAA